MKKFLIFKNKTFRFLLTNIFFLCINLYFLKSKKKQILLKDLNYNFFSKFKNVDFFLTILGMISFNNISFYLSNKFKVFNDSNLYYNSSFKQLFTKNIISKQTKTKKIIRLYTVGSSNNYYADILKNNIIEGLEDNFDFEFTSDKPDYLIYDIFNCDFLESKYNESIKIAFYTENQIPDFNKADYAIGFQNINYLDRLKI